MKLLFDFFPIFLFFIAYKFYGIYVATGVAITATFVQVGFAWIKTRKVETMHMVTLVLICVFGGATLLLHDEMFIKWKPTIINWIFGSVFLGSHFIGKQPFIQKVMGSNLTLIDSVWRRLNMMWALFFLTLGGINLFVIYRFDTETWVNFKLFGLFGLMLLFILIQAVYLSKHMELESQPKE